MLENGQKYPLNNFGDVESSMGGIVSFTAPDLLSVGEAMFCYSDNLKKVYLPSAKRICWGAFRSCKALTEIDLPNVKEIDDEAFYMCESLEKINAPKVEFIGRDVFYECINLQKVILPKISKMDEGIFQYSEKLVEVNLSSLKEFGDSEFFSCDKLQVIDISSAETIGAAAFQNCTNLRYVKAPNVVEIEENAFQDCKHLEFIEIPRVEIIRDYAFYGCEALQSVNLPNVKQVEDSAFCYCDNLKKVVMPSLRKVASRGFFSCPIEIIDIQEDVEADYDSFSLVATKNNPVIKIIQDRAIKESFIRLIEDAEKGDAHAQLLLGHAYAKGKYECELDGDYIGCDTEKNMDLAIEYWKKAADQKHPGAMYWLASEYLSGENIGLNEDEGIRLLISSAESGYTRAQLKLAGYYKEGKYLDKNIDEAKKWYRLAMRNVDAIRDISDYYMKHKCNHIGAEFLRLAMEKNCK